MDDAKNDVTTAGGDFVGRDKHIDGDEVGRDKVLGDKIIYQGYAPLTPKPGSAPPLPGLVVGREDDLRALKTRLGIGGGGQGQGQGQALPLQVLTAIRGWPGIGKTTVGAVIRKVADKARAEG